MDLDQIRRLVLEGRHFFYTHALVEAKKDGVAPEDVVHTILAGEIIEEYPDRERCLVFAMLHQDVPLHVVCDYSQPGVLLIVTAYIPDDGEWIRYRVRKTGRRR